MSTRSSYNRATHALMRAMVEDGTGNERAALEFLHEAQRHMVEWRQQIERRIKAQVVLSIPPHERGQHQALIEALHGVDGDRT